MCDSLGQSDQKVKVWTLTMLGQTTVHETEELLNEAIAENLVSTMSIGESTDLTIKCTEMYEHELDELPEFEGY